jgi:hypothetical protein
MMSKNIFFTMVVILMLQALSLSAVADDFDGSKPLTCASIFSAECNAADQQCITGAPWMINFPVFMEIDFKAKQVSTTKLHETTRTSSINHVARMNDGHTALQGIDDDFIWSMLIAEETGSMTLSISAEDSGYIIFGACHPN